MSLLLEALKKAELAKQNASGQQGEGAPADPGGGLLLEPAPGEPAERTLITRDRLPDITQPLEILSEDLPSAGVRREAPAPSAAAAATAASAGRIEDSERASARQIFEAKTPDYDPRRPFFIVVGTLGVAILGILGYFAYEVFAPRPSFNAGTAGGKVAAATPAPAAPPSAPVAAPAPAAGPAPSPPSEAAPPPTPAPPVATPPQPSPPGVAPTAGREAPRMAARTAARAPVRQSGEPGEPRPASDPRSPVRVTAGPPRVDPTLEEAWDALQAGDLARSKDAYERVLRANPRSRDALLGLATIDARSQDNDAAERRYLRVLELDPRDPYAQAGLIALRGLTDPVQSESRLKNMLAQNPDANFVHFYLGNQYAAQARWPDAQASYFKAFSADPENADFAYNLAISLDHIGQSKLALEYYRRALALAGNRAVGFNSTRVDARIRELTR